MRLHSKPSLIAGGIVLALVLSACSSSDDSFDRSVDDSEEAVSAVGFEEPGAPENEEGVDRVAFDSRAQAPFATGPADIRVIRDGRIDLRVDPGDFAQKSSQVRTIAADLGGYISSGETHLEDIEGVSYAVGWFTLRIPEARFEDALTKAEALGERLGLNISSEDVSEEFVDLQGRLSYWEGQEDFYMRLMDQTTRIDQQVALQAQMQDVLLQIEEVEGRIRYLDSRTQFSTLTVGLSEVPGVVTPPVVEPEDPGIITDALDQAGTVLLSMVAFLIVAVAFTLPIGVVALIVYAVWRAVSGGRKDPDPLEA